jgi:hypothetical protein
LKEKVEGLKIWDLEKRKGKIWVTACMQYCCAVKL